MSKKSSAGEGKPALIPFTTNGNCKFDEVSALKKVIASVL